MKDLCALRLKAPSLVPQMSIVYSAIDQFKPALANRRCHSEQIGQNSIRPLGYNVPILIDRDRHEIAGYSQVVAELPTLCLHLAQAQGCYTAIGRALDGIADEAEAANAV
jgi:hypothetical protein